MNYLLVRETADGTLEGIRFTAGILARMDVSEDEWKPIPTDPLALRKYIN